MTAHASSGDQESSSRAPIAAAFVLLLTALLSLVWSHVRLMENDEFLSFYSDSVPTFRQVLTVQLHHPISLDPPTYHLLSHMSMDFLGRNAAALRMPALSGFLLLEVCLYFFVKRLSGSRTAIIAMAFPLLTASFRYSVEGRPYGLLLGLYAASLLCWQLATLDDGVSRSRLLPLAGLTLAISLAITSHYFGVLILIPVSLGELWRTVTRRRLDFGVVASLAIGLASVGLILPFQRALLVYRQHYYVQQVTWHNITQGYRELFLRYTTWPMALQKLAAALMAIAVLTLAFAAYKRFKARDASEHAHVWIALVSMALLPFFGFLFGRFVTHTMEVKYVIAALIAFAAIFGMVLERRLRSNAFYYGAVTAILAVAALINLHNIVQEMRDTQKVMSAFQLSPSVATALYSNPNKRIYVQLLEDFYLDAYYEPDVTLRSRFTMVYDANDEIKWLGHDTNAITAVNMSYFTPLSIAPYTKLLKQSDPLLLLNHSGWQWVDKQLDADRLPQKDVGSCMRGELVTVQTGVVTH
jgi:4-amino-4-deoxy-L-arabinose transferase-like glycosyltransferase